MRVFLFVVLLFKFLVADTADSQLMMFSKYCYEGDTDMCLDLAQAYGNGIYYDQEVTVNINESIKYYNLVCEQKPEVCEKYAWIRNNIKELNAKLILEEPQTKCDNGNLKSCLELGASYMHGKYRGSDIEKNETLALEILSQICKKDSEFCTQNQVDKRIEELENTIKARNELVDKDFEKDCLNETSDSACIVAGEKYEKNGDTKKALELYKKGCYLDVSSGISCYYAGLLASKDNQQESIKYFNDGCDRKNRESCKFLGDYYKKNAQFEKAIAKFEVACDKEENESCKILADAYKNGRLGLKKDAKKSIEYLEKLCKIDSVEGCYEAGKYYEKIDLDKASRYWFAGCMYDSGSGKNGGENSKNCQMTQKYGIQ